MECKLESENAKILDKLINQFTCTNITIQSTQNTLIFQIIQDDNSLITNINLNCDFFVEFECKKSQIQNITKIKFYKRKMKSLIIKLTNYTLCLTWEFDKYKHKKEIYISDTDLYNLEHACYEYLYLDAKLFYNLLKYFDSKNIEIIYSKNKIKLQSKEKRAEVSCKIDVESDINEVFEVPLCNLKRVFGLYDLADKFCVGIGDTRETINVLIEMPNVSVSIFCAAYT